ncbi:PAS domain-containing sensor histidine kinase [Cognatilysobacter lacus]|uniref:histidine kinase n=1 Tax=Cognatilysobacter lacus TaxID=1643323 RepID=A0A5D8Z810_9GAMM|nr:PAS domain-containing protein [Lysobacter lacus]TZF90686.1 PAS domain-containing protein [Lysobacter lacus]
MTLPFDALFRHSPNAYMVLDRELHFLDANDAYELLTGLQRDQLIGRHLFDLFPGDVNDDGTSQAAVLRRSLERALQTGERDTLALVEYTINTETVDGTVSDVRFWSATHTPVRDTAGNVTAVMQHTMDVTEVHRLREAVRRAREATGVTQDQLQTGVLLRAAEVQRDNVRLSARLSFLDDLFDKAPGFMAVLRAPDYVFEIANEAYEALVGRTGFVGLPLREVLPEIDGQGFYQLLDRVRETGEPFVGRGVAATLRDAHGMERTRFVDFVYQPVPGADGAVDAVFVQGSDVTDRETALAASRESEARFRTIADLVPQMIWSTRADGFHDYYNQRWYDFTGVPLGSNDGETWAGMFHPDDQAGAWSRWRQSLATGEPYQVEYRLRDRTGAYQWVLGRALPVRDAGGAIVRWMGTCTEIDDLKRAQEMLERSEAALREADRQKDQFLATLAHELRNPLAPIVTAVQLLRMAPDREATVRQAAEIIDRQTVHMRSLVEDLIDVSRVTRGLTALQRRHVRLSDVIASAVEQTESVVHRNGHTLLLGDAVTNVVLDADPVRLTQVLTNLLTNAAKYTPAGGTITLSTTVEDGDAVVRLHDTGVGMDADLLARVFDLFAQADATPERHYGGLGIGLSLARSLAQLHGGSLTASSPGPGLGSTFELRVPAVPAVADARA